MEYPSFRLCGCKGCRTCLLCERELGIEKANPRDVFKVSINEQKSKQFMIDLLPEFRSFRLLPGLQ